MKANELFIGAFCLYDTGDGKEINVIDAIDIRSIDQFEHEKDDYQPIPLTPAVVGCIPSNNSDLISRYSAIYEKYEDTRFILFIHKQTGEVSLTMFDVDDNEIDLVLPHIKNLHQLQFLYFALTGEEMKVDIEKLKTVI